MILTRGYNKAFEGKNKENYPQIIPVTLCYLEHYIVLMSVDIGRGTGVHSAVSSVSNSRARGPRFDTQSGCILSFLLPLIQEGQLSVTGKSMCRKHWLTA